MPAKFASSGSFQSLFYETLYLCDMQVVVTIPQHELEGKSEMKQKISLFAEEIKEGSGECKYSPKSGALMNFLTLLKENGVGYTTHFDMREDLPDTH